MYSRRRAVRYRMIRRNALVNQIKDVAASIKTYTSETLCAIGILAGVFYLIPIAIKIIADMIK